MDRDIKEMFREKNNAILINNLKYDLDKNVNSLLETFINIFNLEFDTAIKNIVSILEDSEVIDSNKFVTDFINRMKLMIYEEIEELLSDKKQQLVVCVDDLDFSEEQLNNYYDIVFSTTKNFKDVLKKYCIDVLEKDLKLINDYILENVNDDRRDLAISRVNDYLRNRLYGKLETKIHMEIMLRDNNLINKAKESYLRFQEISNKTEKTSIE